MIEHQEIYYSNFSTKQLFLLVKDIEKYPEFLPWCSAARVDNVSEVELRAELVVKFSVMRESYVSKVILSSPESENDDCSVDVEAIEGPFKYLKNTWGFESDENGRTKVTFSISFEFQSKLLQKMMGSMFEESLKKMLKCFEDRAKYTYK